MSGSESVNSNPLTESEAATPYMYSVMVIWSQVPTNLQVYIITMTQEEFDKWSRCHGHYAGLTDTPADVADLINELYEGLKSYTPHHDDEERKNMPQNVCVERVIITGGMD